MLDFVMILECWYFYCISLSCMKSYFSPITGKILMKTMTIKFAVAMALAVGAVSVNASTVILENSKASSLGSKSFSGSATWTYDSVFDLALDITGKGTTWVNWTLTAVGSGNEKDGYSAVNSDSFTETTVWEDLGPGTYSFSYFGQVKTNSEIYLTLTSTVSPTAPVPEPETYAMLLVGLGLAGVAARRRRTL